MANKQNGNVIPVIFRFPPPNFSVCGKAQRKSHRRSLQMKERLCEDQISLSACHIVAARKSFIGLLWNSASQCFKKNMSSMRNMR